MGEAPKAALPRDDSTSDGRHFSRTPLVCWNRSDKIMRDKIMAQSHCCLIQRQRAFIILSGIILSEYAPRPAGKRLGRRLATGSDARHGSMQETPGGVQGQGGRQDQGHTVRTIEVRTMIYRPVLNGPVLNGPVLNGPVLNGPVLNGPVLNGPVLNGPVLNDPVINGPVLNSTDPDMLGQQRKEIFLLPNADMAMILNSVMRIYLDNCCFSRPFDDQDHYRTCRQTWKSDLRAIVLWLRAWEQWKPRDLSRCFFASRWTTPNGGRRHGKGLILRPSAALQWQQEVPKSRASLAGFQH